jgi:hypothetical protein
MRPYHAALRLRIKMKIKIRSKKGGKQELPEGMGWRLMESEIWT